MAWTAGVYNGLQPVLNYRIYYDQGTGSWIVLDMTTNPYYTAVGITAGVTYSFKVQSQNIVGYSQFSTAISLVAA